MKKFTLLFSLLFLFHSVITIVHAQVTTSSLSGVVIAEGESIPGATVMAVHEPSGTRYGVLTNADGRYNIQGMRVGGPYTVEISFIGYTKAIFKDITLQLGETFTLNAKLAQSSELLDEIVVIGKKSKFTTERTGAVVNISRSQMTTVPTISRSLEDVVRLSPYASGMDFGGHDGRQNTFTVDGANLNNNFGLNKNLPGGGNPISTEALEEIQVVIAPYDVRQANFIGAGINAITKSGTNTFTGSAYTYQTNEKMRGNKIGDNDFGPRNKESKSITGATFGGPIVKNKLFFFTNFEYTYSPKQVITWRASDDGVTDNSSISRTTKADLQQFSDLLKERYGYNTGSFTDFPAEVSNVKFLGRIDWNINQANKLSVRYNYTKNQDWNAPNGNSCDTGYRMRGKNRVSQYSMSFANSMYSQDNIVNTVTTELNSRIGQKASNRALFTFSDIRDIRGSNSDLFPFIDIMYGLDGDGNQIFEPYMSAGYELFTYNNGVKNKVYNFVDNFSYSAGKHKITAGVSYEWQRADNSYIRNGTGYYRFRSFDEFKNGADPESFALTYGWNGEKSPSAYVAFQQIAGYAQDEWNIRDNFKLTAGVRLDNITFLNDLMANNAINALEFNGKHIDTGAWPSSKVQVSPRAGFIWDIFGDKSLKLRGGTGLFTGRLPLVFFTNMPTNSSMVQNAYLATTTYKNGIAINKSSDLSKLYDSNGLLYTKTEDMIAALGMPTTISPEEGRVSSVAVGIDPDFKMPQIWKSSLAVDYQLPVSFPLGVTLEGTFTKNVNAIYQNNYNIRPFDETWEKFEGPDNRYIFPVDYLYYPKIKKGANVLSNTNKGWGYTANITVNAEPVDNLSLMFAYTHTESKEISGLPGSDANSSWINLPSVNGPNSAGLARSQYVTPDRFIGSATYKIEYAKKHLATIISLFYSAYSPYSDSFVYSNDMNGDAIPNDLIYIPAKRGDIEFVDQANEDAYWKFAEKNRYLKKHGGEYAEAYTSHSPLVHKFDLHLAQNFAVKVGNSTNTLQLSVDIKNFGNMLNSKWGINKSSNVMNNGAILTYEGKDANNVPLFSFGKDKSGNFFTDSYSKYNVYTQCWQLQVGLKYLFN